MDVWTELVAPHRHPEQAKAAVKQGHQGQSRFGEGWWWSRNQCDTERQEQGRGWTGAVWVPERELWRELAQDEEQTGRAGSSEGWEGWSVRGFS